MPGLLLLRKKKGQILQQEKTKERKSASRLQLTSGSYFIDSQSVWWGPGLWHILKKYYSLKAPQRMWSVLRIPVSAMVCVSQLEIPQ
jgi:hypothetical protein